MKNKRHHFFKLMVFCRKFKEFCSIHKLKSVDFAEKFNKKIILTGGHAASSAFVVVEEIRRIKKPWDIYWIGFKSSLEGEKYTTLSSMFFPKYGIKTYSLFTGRIQRKWTVHTIPSLLKIPVGFFHSFYLLLKIRPNLILSFGGFSAFPVVFVAYFLKIPIILHEQTSVVGRANKYSSYFANKIAISRETSRVYFPSSKTVLTGNPVPRDIIKKRISRIEKGATILITGGQSGSVTINETVQYILPVLLKKYNVIHLTGLKDEDKFRNIRESFDNHLKNKYRVYGIVDPKKYNQFFNESFVVVSRGGANTVSKIVVSKKLSVLIPLPISYLNEQEKNALFASDFGGARIISQDQLNPKRLLEEINYLINNWTEISKNISVKDNPDIKAAEKLVDLIQENIK